MLLFTLLEIFFIIRFLFLHQQVTVTEFGTNVEIFCPSFEKLPNELMQNCEIFQIYTPIPVSDLLLLEISNEIIDRKPSQKQGFSFVFFISCSQWMEAGASGPAGPRALRHVVLSGSLATGAVLVLCQWQEGRHVQTSKKSTRASACRQKENPVLQSLFAQVTQTSIAETLMTQVVV